MRGLLAIATLASLPAVGTGDEAHKPVAELAALNRFVGKWNATIVNTAPDGSHTRHTESKALSWILDGHFLEEASDFGRGKSRTLFGYDKVRQEHCSWYFQSNGSAHKQYGTWKWDSDGKIMTWTSEQDGNQVVARFLFTSQDEYTSITAVKDKTGRLVTRIEGKYRRRMEPSHSK